MPFGGNDWHALRQEETLEPEIPICDPHHHFWDYRSERIPYPALPAPRAGRRHQQRPQRYLDSVRGSPLHVSHRRAGGDAAGG